MLSIIMMIVLWTLFLFSWCAYRLLIQAPSAPCKPHNPSKISPFAVRDWYLWQTLTQSHGQVGKLTDPTLCYVDRRYS